jgi:hypothetical protein
MSNRDRTPSPKKYTIQNLIKNGAFFNPPSPLHLSDKKHNRLNEISVIEAIKIIDQEERIKSQKKINHKEINKKV